MRYFGVAEANQLIPLLNRVFDRVRPLTEQLQRFASELDALQNQGTQDAHRERLHERHDALLEQIRAELTPLEEMGVEVKAADGLVDFHAQLDGRTVYLCWRYGEKTVAYWHELHTGFAGRQPIKNPAAFAPTYLS